jgi:hypothetical protein
MLTCRVYGDIAGLKNWRISCNNTDYQTVDYCNFTYFAQPNNWPEEPAVSTVYALGWIQTSFFGICVAAGFILFLCATVVHFAIPLFTEDSFFGKSSPTTDSTDSVKVGDKGVDRAAESASSSSSSSQPPNTTESPPSTPSPIVEAVPVQTSSCRPNISIILPGSSYSGENEEEELLSSSVGGRKLSRKRKNHGYNLRARTAKSMKV